MSPAAQPLLEHDQAEEKLVIILSHRIVSLERSAHRLRLEQIEHQGVRLKRSIFGRFPSSGGIETSRPPH